MSFPASSITPRHVMRQARAYFNEIDPFAAQWLRNLISAGHIAPGDVDERSIADVQPDDLKGYVQCHFFAGIAGWSLALRRAGWPDDRPVWTGSCPCQPISKAGRRLAARDARHLWPYWWDLIRERRPRVCFGEQVAVGLGRTWLDQVSSDLDGMGYACGAVVAAAAGFGSEHVRDRLWFVAHPVRPGRTGPVEHRHRASGLVQAQELQRCHDGIPARVFTGTDRASVLPIDGSARSVDVVRAFGNAIDVRPATAFIAAYLDIEAKAA